MNLYFIGAQRSHVFLASSLRLDTHTFQISDAMALMSGGKPPVATAICEI